MHPRLHAALFYRTATALRGEGAVFQYLAEFRATENAGAAAMERSQIERLERLLTYVAHNNPYYRERFGSAHAIPASEAREALASMPFLEKSDVQRFANRLRTPRHRGRTSIKSTGGSTAEPVSIVKDSDGLAQEMAASWLAMSRFGIHPGDRSVRFWGTPLTAARRTRFRLADLAMNRIRLSAFELEEDDLARYWTKLERFRPAWFYGYATLIDLLAQWVESTGHDGRAVGLRCVVPTSEPLDEEMKERMERVFGCPVQNEYGCGEVGAIAYGCEQGRLHLMTETSFVEVLDETGQPAMPGETGEIVVTDLTNFAMPLIRYRLKDYGILSAGCECGQSRPALETVWGRAYDTLFTPAGKRWHGEKVKYLLTQVHAEMGGFRQFQVVQDGPDTLDIRLVTDEEVSSALEARVKDYIAEHLDGMRARVRRVDAIERARSGKFRVIRNDWLEKGGEDSSASGPWP